MNNYLKLGTMGIAALMAAILFGIGDLLFGTVLLLIVVLLFFIWPKSEKGSR